MTIGSRDGRGRLLAEHGEPWPDGAASALERARAAGPSS
jgi:hypothetical protein